MGRGLQGQAQVDSNNSLILRPLTKEAHGRWECSARNAVAQVTTSTNVYVLGWWPGGGLGRAGASHVKEDMGVLF